MCAMVAFKGMFSFRCFAPQGSQLVMFRIPSNPCFNSETGCSLISCGRKPLRLNCVCDTLYSRMMSMQASIYQCLSTGMDKLFDFTGNGELNFTAKCRHVFAPNIG